MIEEIWFDCSQLFEITPFRTLIFRQVKIYLVVFLRGDRDLAAFSFEFISFCVYSNFVEKWIELLESSDSNQSPMELWSANSSSFSLLAKSSKSSTKSTYWSCVRTLNLLTRDQVMFKVVLKMFKFCLHGGEYLIYIYVYVNTKLLSSCNDFNVLSCTMMGTCWRL